MAQDRNHRVGCAMISFNQNEVVMTCNYAFTNIGKSFVYRKGTAAINCKTGANPNFPNLCSEFEEISPSPYV